MNCSHVLAFFVLGALPALPASPVASVTSKESFQIGKTVVPVQAVPNWPLVVGDEISTDSAPAVITLKDGTRIVLGQKSAALLERSQSGVRIRLRQGSLSYRLGDKPSTEIAGLDLASIPEAFSEGAVYVVNNAAYFNAAEQRRKITTLPVKITPFNLGYLQNLQDCEPNELAGPNGNNCQSPPKQPDSQTPSDTGRLNSLSNTQP